MRELDFEEISLIAGGGDSCTAVDGNYYDPGTGQSLTNLYVALVAATSELIERVAELFD